MDGPFSGRVALNTGASGGIGQALARRLAGGGAVPGLGYSAHGQAAQALAAEITSADGTAPAIGADLRRPQAPSQLVQSAAEALGPVDVPGWSATPAEPSPAAGGHHRRPLP